MAKGSDDKINAVCGVAAVTALVATLLIISSLNLLLTFASAFVIDLPLDVTRVGDIVQQLLQIKVPVPDATEALVLSAIAGFAAISITTTVAAVKISR